MDVSEKVLAELTSFIAGEKSKGSKGLEFLKNFEFHRCGSGGVTVDVKVKLTIEGNCLMLQAYDPPSRKNLGETDEEFKARLKSIKDRFDLETKNYKKVKKILGIF